MWNHHCTDSLKWGLVVLLFCGVFAGRTEAAHASSLNHVKSALKKIYIKPEKVWIDASGIYVLEHGDLYPVPQIGYDNQGVFCTGVIWDKCPCHHKWYTPLGGCVSSDCEYYYRKHRE